MSKVESKKQAIIAIAVIAVIALVVGYVYPQSEQKRPNYSIPDGFVKGESKVKENEIIHEFSKPAPDKQIPKQSHEQTFERYINALPAKERAEGIEFKTLFSNRQNAQMYADYTGLMARASENKAKIAKNIVEAAEINSEKSKTEETSVEIIPNHLQDTNKAFKADGSPSNSNVATYKEEDISLSDRLLDSIIFRGTYKRRKDSNSTYGALIKLNGKSKRVTAGQTIAADLKVLKVNEFSIVVKSLNKERTFSSEGGA